jgi:hypothetical protein
MPLLIPIIWREEPQLSLGQKIRWHALTCLPIERSFADAMTNTMIAGFDTERRVASGPASET